MRLEQIILTLAGIAIIAALFLPYLTLQVAGQEVMTISGVSIAQSGLEKAEVIADLPGDSLVDFLWDTFNETTTTKERMSVIGLIFICLGPIIFALYALGYIFRGLRGKQYKRGIFFTLLFTAAAWLIFKFLGAQLGTEFSFFSMAGPGFWVAFGGMLAAAFSVFFERGARSAS